MIFPTFRARAAPGGRAGSSRTGLRAAALVLTATALPVVTLIWASDVASTEVQKRALAGLVATAKATVLQEEQAWEDAIRVVQLAASRPVPLSALQSRDTSLVSQGAQNILITGPFSAVRIYGATGDLVATAAAPGVTPTVAVFADVSGRDSQAGYGFGIRTRHFAVLGRCHTCQAQ